MSKIIFLLLLSIFVFQPASAMVSDVTPEDKVDLILEQSHLPTTEVEKALRHILKLDEENNDLGGFMFGYPWYKHTRDNEFKPLFTKSFVEKNTKEEHRLIKESCGGEYPKDGLPCDMIRGYSVLHCGNDYTTTPFYRTIKSNDKEVIITTTFYPSPAEGPTYRFIKEDNRWKLDEACLRRH